MLDTLRVEEDCQTLALIWDDGTETRLAATTLRAQARDASTIRQRIDTNTVKVMLGIEITAMEMVGSTGINIHFSDGHERAIYPISYLKELSDRFDN